MKPKPYKINGDMDAETGVVKVFYNKRYVIIKHKNQCHALQTLEKSLAAYIRGSAPNPEGLYYPLLLYVKKNPGGVFKVSKIIANASDAKRKKWLDDKKGELPTYSGYDILVAEQTALDESRDDPNMLNNATDAYIPQFNPETDMYGWLTRGDVLNFNNWKGKRHKSRPAKNKGVKSSL